MVFGGKWDYKWIFLLCLMIFFFVGFCVCFFDGGLDVYVFFLCGLKLKEIVDGDEERVVLKYI